MKICNSIIVMCTLVLFCGCQKNLEDLSFEELVVLVNDKPEIVRTEDFLNSFVSVTDKATYSVFKDPRDGYEYKTIAMRDGNIWFAENVRYNVDGSYCYDLDSDNCKTLGKLYKKIHLDNICPQGWQIPSRQDWFNLVSVYGPVNYRFNFTQTENEEINAQKAQEALTSGKFKILRSGHGTKAINSTRLSFDDIHEEGEYWSKSQDNNGRGYFLEVENDDFELNKDTFKGTTQRALRYCRCVKQTAINRAILSE